MPSENDKIHRASPQAETRLNDQLLTGVENKWKTELAAVLPHHAPSEAPLCYRQEISKSVHAYLQTDKNFTHLNKQLHHQHALDNNLKVVGVAVHNGLPELVVVNTDKEHKHAEVKAFAVSAETGKVTGTFSKDANGGLFHSDFVPRSGSQFPMPDRNGAIIWREGHGTGRIREIDTPQGVKEIVNYDPIGRIQKLDFMIGTRPLCTYQRNEDGSYDAIQPHQRVLRHQIDTIKVTDDGSQNAGKITFSMLDGRLTKYMKPNGEVRQYYQTSI